MKRCKVCGSYAFNLYKEAIDQGDLCDVHYWKEKALSTKCVARPAVTESHKQSTTCGEPVAWMQPDEVHISLWKDDFHTIPLYTTPYVATPRPQRTAAEGEDTKAWVELSEEQKRQLNESLNLQGRFPIIDAIEAMCKGNNT